jgi:hypothetical protein
MVLFIQGEAERKIRFVTGMSAGSLHRLSIDLGWILDGFSCVSGASDVGCPQAVTNNIGMLVRRVRWGAPAEALDVLRIANRRNVPGFGRQRVMALIANGLGAGLLNDLLIELEHSRPPSRYHDNEDCLANFVIERLKWPIKKRGNRWVGVNYDSILEQGGIHDVDQANLLLAAAGRIHVAKKLGQTHFDDMEKSHRRMLGAVLTIILYCRSDLASG